MKRLFTAREFISQFRNNGYRKIQIRKLLFVAYTLFKLEPENVAIVICTDAKWNTRRNRTPLERLAIKVGHSVHVCEGKEYQYVIWAYPVISLPTPEHDEKRKIMSSFNGHQRKPPSKKAANQTKTVKQPNSI